MNTVGFPAVACSICSNRCETSCQRVYTGGDAIKISEIERACIEYTKKTTPDVYSGVMKEERIAIIGAGAIAGVHIDAYKQYPDRCEVRAVCDIFVEKAQQLIDQYGLENAVAVKDFHDILSDDRIDAVSICLPPSLHAPTAVDCLKGGKHVICEKPIALNYADAKEMLDTAENKGCHLYIAQVLQFTKEIQALHKLVESGEYGKVLEICEKVLEVAPADSSKTLRAWSTMGDVYYKLGDSKKAFKAYGKALKVNPDYVYVLNNYAYYLSVEGRKLKKACDMSYKTVIAEPDNATYLDTYAWILHLQGKDDAAKLFFKKAMLYGGKESAVILDHYAEVLYALKEYDVAFIYWNMALQKDDGDLPGLKEKVLARKKEAGR